MPEKYYNLVSRNSFSFVNQLIDNLSKEFYIEIPIEEKIFVFLPIIGMRTPADSKNMYSIELDEKIHPLLKKIVEGIRLELNISIDPHEFAEKFMYHIMFMITGFVIMYTLIIQCLKTFITNIRLHLKWQK